MAKVHHHHTKSLKTRHYNGERSKEETIHPWLVGMQLLLLVTIEEKTQNTILLRKTVY
jgi:hypothetical protein